MNRILQTGVVASVLLWGGGTAFAHAHLRGADPAANATVAASADSLKLVFSEGIQLSLSGIAVRGPDGAMVPTRQAQLAPGDDKELRVPLARTLAPGRYTVQWHAFSNDGHTTRGSYEFRVVD